MKEKVEMKVGKGGMKVWMKEEVEGEGGDRVDRVCQQCEASNVQCAGDTCCVVEVLLLPT